jgi:SsrA-binding protein
MCSVDTDSLHHLARSRPLRPVTAGGDHSRPNAGPSGPAFARLPPFASNLRVFGRLARVDRPLTSTSPADRSQTASLEEPAMGEEKTVAQNRKARHEYSIEDSFEAGIALTGTEIKSIRAGKVSLADAYARIDRGEAWLIGANIAQWETGNRYNHEPKRQRKLLLHRDEIMALLTKTKAKGLTLVPLKMYITGRGRAKLEIGLGRGKQLHDRRRDIADRDSRREMDRAIADADRGRDRVR